jgi:hypothetical protein
MKPFATLAVVVLALIALAQATLYTLLPVFSVNKKNAATTDPYRKCWFVKQLRQPQPIEFARGLNGQ